MTATDIAAPALVSTRADRELAVCAAWLAVGTAIVCGLGAGAFGWSIASTVAGGAIGATVGACVWFQAVVRRQLPGESVRAAPDDIAIGRPAFVHRVWLLVGLPVCGASTWLARDGNLVPLIVPALWAGATVAAAVAVIRIRQWESRQGAQLLRVRDATALNDGWWYAAIPLSPAERR